MKAMVIVVKGDQNISNNAAKAAEMNVILRFVAKCVPRCELLMDANTMVLNMPKADEGDHIWVKDRVLSRAYLDGVYSDADAEKKAEKLYGIYMAQDDREGKVGLGLIRYELRQLYLDERGSSIYLR